MLSNVCRIYDVGTVVRGVCTERSVWFSNWGDEVVCAVAGSVAGVVKLIGGCVRKFTLVF